MKLTTPINFQGVTKPISMNDYQRAEEEFQARKAAALEERAFKQQQLELQKMKMQQERVPAAEQKINRMMESLGVDRATAVGIADGAVKVITDPMTNQPFMVNMATGTQQPLNMQQQRSAQFDAPQQEQQPQRAAGGKVSLYDLAGETAGILPSIKRTASALTGQIGLPIAEKSINAAQQMEIAKNDLVRALAVNPRFAEGELKRLSKEISIAPSAFDSSPALRQRMQAINTQLVSKLQNAQRDARDTSLPLDTRKAQASNAQAIKNFLDSLNVPQETQTQKRSLDDIFQ
jgi:hypothetical protein